MKNRIMSLLIAVLLATSALAAVSGDGSDPLDPSDGGADWDGDGLTNAEEQQHGTNMNNADSDGDGLPDGWEVANGLNPTNGGDGNADPDGDGLTNSQEYAKGTNPNNSDTDGDGKADGSGLPMGTNYINLASGMNMRDNLRQGAVDLMVLRASIANMASLDANNVAFVGHGIGASVGVVFLSEADNLGLPTAPAVLVGPLSGIARSMEVSGSFGGFKCLTQFARAVTFFTMTLHTSQRFSSFLVKLFPIGFIGFLGFIFFSV